MSYRQLARFHIMTPKNAADSGCACGITPKSAAESGCAYATMPQNAVQVVSSLTSV